MTTDNLLAQAQSLAVPWVDSPFFATLLQRAELDVETKKLARTFAEQGYVIFDPRIPDAWMDGARSEVKDRFYPGSGNYFSDERRIQDGWLFGENVRKIATAPRVLEVLEALYGRKPFPFQTLNFRVGSEQKTHSDQAYFDSIPHGYMCGVWVALEDVDESNGPLHYYPGSQKLPMFNVHNLGIVPSRSANPVDLIPRYEEFVEALMPASGLARQELRIQKGQALIWAANLYHGGCPILDRSRTRATQVTHYYFEGCLYYTPIGSDPGLGRLMPRRILDARDGQEVQQFYNGCLIANPGEWPPRLIDELQDPAPATAPVEVQQRLTLMQRAFAALRAR